MTSDEHRQAVRDSFTRQADLFRGEGSVFATASDAVLAWVGALSPDDVVLEVACGAAHVAEQVARHVRAVVGVDLTRALLDLGAERLAAAGVRNVVLQEGDAERLPFLDECFDLVCCRTALHHMGDPRAAIAEMARVLRPGGRLAVSDLVAPSADTRDAFDALHRLMDPSHARALLADEMTGFLPDGLVVEATKANVVRAPVDVALNEQSDRDAVHAALDREIAGGPPTGLAPERDGSTVTVAYSTVTAQARRPWPERSSR